MTASYDRTTQDSGNIVSVEHVNVCVPDQQIATAFYVLGLGFTRDPYLMVGLDNMWVNLGRSQFHLPTAKPQRLRGTLGVVTPSLDELARRLERVSPHLAGTLFAFRVEHDRVDVTCPWGNRFRCHAPAPELGLADLALAYIEFDIERGSADGIARFYREGMRAKVELGQRAGRRAAIVTAGAQKLAFVESDSALPAFDGHHMQIYIADFSAAHDFLRGRNLITEESNAHQYRFCDIVDPADGKRLFQIEHEVRSLAHPLYNRQLINRNPAQSLGRYSRGYDGFRGAC